MMRFLAPVLWIFVTLAFGFDAVAEPCDLRMQVTAEQPSMNEMPCHDGMMMGSETETPDAPGHQKETCCCAALLTNAITFAQVGSDQPAPGLSLWASPLPDHATSISIEYEPPPPRA
ncbi:MAG: hypothetical protein AAGJ84_12325 [Pseudomonadota bacterium]